MPRRCNDKRQEGGSEGRDSLPLALSASALGLSQVLDACAHVLFACVHACVILWGVQHKTPGKAPCIDMGSKDGGDLVAPS
eukprot:scaffold34651_cov152-Isochrysis_galbana.AAC.5